MRYMELVNILICEVKHPVMQEGVDCLFTTTSSLVVQKTLQLVTIKI